MSLVPFTYHNPELSHGTPKRLDQGEKRHHHETDVYPPDIKQYSYNYQQQSRERFGQQSGRGDFERNYALMEPTLDKETKDRIEAEERYRAGIRSKLDQADEDDLEEKSVGRILKEREEVARKKKRGRNRILKIIVGGVALVILAANLLSTTSLPADVASLTCSDLKAAAERQTLKNAFGADIEVLSVENLTEVKKSDREIVCEGPVLLSNGNDPVLTVKATERDDGKVYYHFQTK